MITVLLAWVAPRLLAGRLAPPTVSDAAGPR